MGYQRVGGLHFVSVGRFSLSFCIRNPRLALERQRAALRAAWARDFTDSLYPAKVWARRVRRAKRYSHGLIG